MESQKIEKTKKRTNLFLTLVAVFSIALAFVLVTFVLNDSVAEGVDSKVAREFVDPNQSDESQADYSSSVFPATYGKEGAAKALVLYDGNVGDSEVLGILAANLATHFGQSTLVPISEYKAGQIADFDAVIYQGYDYTQNFPQELITDIRDGGKKVLWANANLEKVAGEEGSLESNAFIEKYGWDPHKTLPNAEDSVSSIEYKGEELNRHENSRSISVPAIVDPSKVEVLGSALCGSKAEPKACKGVEGESFPWAIRSGNITYVGDLPFEWQQEGSHYLALADLYYDLLAPDAAPSKKAAVRLEDVSPLSNPEDLRRVADFLNARNIPFQVAVIPYFVSEADTDAKKDKKDENLYRGLSLKDKPEVVKALKYMQEKGGTLIQHGTTHQFGALHNPYLGAATAADYEFVRSRCTDQEKKPWQFEDCENDSWVQLTGPLPDDSIQAHADRVEAGRKIFVETGLGAPEIFEVPHYGATPNAYEGIGKHYEYRYEQTDYFSGLVSGKNQDYFTSLTQILPYSVTDVYGSKVLPENLGNPSLEMQNNHAARPPSLLVDNARKSTVVRESTASFFFHPYLDVKILDEIVTGIEGLGYTFVPAKEI